MSGAGSRRNSKLVRPPVKLACLGCRVSRIRCDGEEICANCYTKNKTCTYTKSNRGGPRVSRQKAAQAEQQSTVSKLPTPPREDDEVEHDQQQGFELMDDFSWDLFSPMIMPGAGLKTVDSDHIFDSIFGGRPQGNGCKTQVTSIDIEMPDRFTQPPICRAYDSNEAILNGYYIFMHPYFPILPPPVSDLVADEPLAFDPTDFELSSPISLALYAILVLIPHPNDPDPTHPDSVLLRRQRAHKYAQSAMDAIEIETEMLASSFSPGDALSSDPESLQRQSFHPRTPIEIEGLLAYLVLSVYEYSQRGNIAKCRNRASQAYDAAIRLSLHEGSKTVDEDQFSESRRRAWWMTYICVLQSSIVSSLAPIIHIEYKHFKTPLPTVAADLETWHAYLDSQQLILQCTQFTVALKTALESKSDLAPIYSRMTALNQEIDLLAARYNWFLDDPPSTRMVAQDEYVVAVALKAQGQIKFNSARIKLHRYRAFLDAPVFTKRHCDLQQSKPEKGPRCECSSSFTLSPTTSHADSVDSTSSSYATSASSTSGEMSEASPFSSPEAARVCMKAALNISRAFEALPYPNPSLTHGCSGPTFLSNTSLTPAPRTMPAFACCAMQSSYSLLMLCRKSHEWNRNAVVGAGYHDGLEELYTGLQRVLRALQNYSLAFEGIDGMRSQVQEAFDGTIQHGKHIVSDMARV